MHNARASEPTRFRLPGPSAGVRIKLRGYLFPRAVLEEAICEAALVARAGLMVAHVTHPALNDIEGKIILGGEPGDRAALVKDCFVDQFGQSWWDYQILPTSKGRELETNVLARAPLGTSIICDPLEFYPNVEGQTTLIVKRARFLTLDTVVNPCATSTLTRPVILSPPSLADPFLSRVMSPEPEEARLRLAHAQDGSAIFHRMAELRGELLPILEERRRLHMRSSNLRVELSDLTGARALQIDQRGTLARDILRLDRQLESDEERIAGLDLEIHRRQFELERLVSYVEEMKETLAHLEKELAPGSHLSNFEREAVIALAKAEAAVERSSRAREGLEQLQAGLESYFQAGQSELTHEQQEAVK